MPETLDDLFAAVSADVARRTSAPGAREVIAASRRRIAGVAVASAIAVLLAAVPFTLLGGDRSHDEPAPASPTPTEGLDVGDVAVWYDDAGLHRGDVVEQTAVRVRTRGGPSGLSLVRTGALYLDGRHQEVWFHPWGGEPMVVGHDSRDGAVGDPQGDTAAWFEGSELVVYDTGRLREVVRVSTTPADPDGGEHFRDGPGILQVTADSVMWRTRSEGLLQLDVASGRVSQRPTGTGRSKRDTLVIDVHDGTQLVSPVGGPNGAGLVLRPAGAKGRPLAGVEPRGRFSPDGRYVLAITADPHGAALVDVGTGESVDLPGQNGSYYAWIAWSYGSTTIVHVTDEGEAEVSKLLACDAERRHCDQLSPQGDVVLPST